MGNSIFEKLIAKMNRNKNATEKEELQKLKDIKKAVRRAKSIEELELVLDAIKDANIMTEEEIEKLKNKNNEYKMFYYTNKELEGFMPYNNLYKLYYEKFSKKASKKKKK